MVMCRPEKEFRSFTGKQSFGRVWQPEKEFWLVMHRPEKEFWLSTDLKKSLKKGFDRLLAHGKREVGRLLTLAFVVRCFPYFFLSFHFYPWFYFPFPSVGSAVIRRPGNLNTNSITCPRLGSWSGSASGLGPSFCHLSHRDFPLSYLRAIP